MKKTHLYLLSLVALVVSGCTSTPKKKKQSSSDVPATQTSAKPGTSVGPTSQSVTTSSSVPPSGSSATSQTPPPVGTEVTRTIATCLDDFETGTTFAAGGRQIDNHDEFQPNDKKQNAELLTGYFTSICNIEGMISSITYTALNTNVDRTNGKDIYLTIGTSDAGKIVWNSTTPMKKVVLKVNNYHKWYRDYAKGETEEQWHTDSAKLIVNGSETSMVVTETNVEPESRIVTYEPSETFTTLTIENELIGGTDNNRIFLESIQITWIY